MDAERHARAAARRDRIVIRKTLLGEGDEFDLTQHGEAISLVTVLTREGWAMAGRHWPDYGRTDTPYRFVLGFGE